MALGRAGAGLPTEALLDFTLDHARARDAVHAAFDVATIDASLRALGLEPVQVSSRAPDRRDYLRRPDLGRMLEADSQRRLAERAGAGEDLVLVIADGLSPTAVNLHAADVTAQLLPLLKEARIAVGYVVVASGARVALGDEIGEILKARMAAVLIGESGPELERLFRGAGLARTERAVTLEEAVATAASIARDAGKASGRTATVLLSPAAASFDMFEDYEARGRAFKAAVGRLAGEGA